MEFGHGFLGALLTKGQALGVVRTDLPHDLLVGLLMANDEAADRWLAEHWDELSADELAAVAEKLFDVVRRIAEPRE